MVSLWLLGVALPTRAQEDADGLARHHFEAGRTYFEHAQYEDAHREFAEAYRLSRRPTLLLNMSRAREAGGDAAGAADELSKWIAQADSEDPSLEDAQKRLARLKAQAAVQSARTRGPTEPASSVPAAAPAPPTERVSTSERRRRRAAYSLLGTGGGSAIAGGLLVAFGRADVRAVESPSAGTSWQSVEDEYDRGPRRVAIGVSLLSVGALALVTSGVLLFWRKGAMERRVGYLLPGGQLGGRF